MAVFDELEALVLANHPECKNVATALGSIGEAPSFSIAVLEDGVITSRCYSTVGDTTETVFQACSVSKPINALGVMKLIEQGRFTPASTVGKLLPKDLLELLLEGSPESQRPLVEAITVKQLMSHTAGLTVHGFIGYSSRDKVPTAKEILSGNFPANSARIRLGALPGHSQSYSGGGITVLQWIVESVTGTDYSKFMQDIVLGPLGMTRSHYGELPATEKDAAKAYYTQYTKADSDHHVMPELAAAGLWTTPTDLLKAVIGVQKSLQGVDGALLKKETAELMLTTVSDKMALSWMRPNGATFQHNGANYPGFRSSLYGYAKLDTAAEDVPENCGFCMMANGNGEASVVGWKVAKAITDSKKWPLTGSGATDSIQPFRPVDGGRSDEWKGWKGTWVAAEDGTGSSQKYRVVEESAGDDGKPVLFYGDVGPIPMLRTAKDKEFELEGLQMKVTLEEEDGNKTISVVSGLSEEAVELVPVKA